MRPGPPRRSHPRQRAGLGLIELLVVLAIAALLAGIAYPSYQGAVHKARRSEALAWFAQLQLAQARHRANHPRHATLAELGLGNRTPGGHFALSEEAPTETGYEVLASATGGQAADLPCRHLRLQSSGAEVRLASGPDTRVANPDATNRRCWAQ